MFLNRVPRVKVSSFYIIFLLELRAFARAPNYHAVKIDPNGGGGGKLGGGESNMFPKLVNLEAQVYSGVAIFFSWVLL